MKYLTCVLLFIGSSVLTGFACSSRTAAGGEGGLPAAGVQENPGPLVVTIAEPTLVKGRLKFEWEIKNTAPEPLYVYSTLIEHAQLAEVVASAETHLVEVHFLRLKPLNILPYSFPEATFVEIPPGEVLRGRFASKFDLEHVAAPDANKNDVKAVPPQSPWRVKAVIAFGREIESVRTKLEGMKAEGIREHPINPVVGWQKIVSSEPVALRM